MTLNVRTSGGNKKGKKEGFGSIRKLPSDRYQVRFTAPNKKVVTAPLTFDTLATARKFLSLKQSEIVRNKWNPTAKYWNATFAEFAQPWIFQRELKPRTYGDYSQILDKHLIPAFGGERLPEITPDMIREWYSTFGRNTPSLRARTYNLFRRILGSAVEDGLIIANPCHIRGAGNAKRVHKIKPATLEELEVIVSHKPNRLQAMTLLAAWCALRFGELVELRRKDLEIDVATDFGVIHIRRGATRALGKVIIGTPKSASGSRDVAIPPHLLPLLADHLEFFVDEGKAALLFSGRRGQTLHPSSDYGCVEHADSKGRIHPAWGFYKARMLAGCPDLRWHDLRHTGAVLAASTGATLAELMGRLGHSSPAAALRYQHVARGRDFAIAEALSKIAAK